MIAQSKAVCAKSSLYAIFFHDAFDDQVQNLSNSIAVIQEHDLFWCEEGQTHLTALHIPYLCLWYV